MSASGGKCLTRAVNLTFNEFTSHSSIHGLKYVTRRGPLHRFLWFIVIIFAIVSSVFLVMVFWKNYLSNPTRIILGRRNIDLSNVPFPAVTVCGPRRLSQGRINNFLTYIYIPNHIDVDHLREIIPYASNFVVTTGIVNPDNAKLEILREVLKYNNLSVETTMTKLRPNCTEYIIKCKWDGDIIPCDELFERSTTVLGFCCSFNYRSPDMKTFTPKKTKNFGFHTGLTLVIKQDTMEPRIKKLSKGADLSRVMIHKGQSYAGINSFSEALEEYVEAFIGIDMNSITSSSEVRQLGIDERDCVFPDEKKLKYFRQYTQYDCLLECSMRHLIQKCGCQTYVYPTKNSETICNFTKIPCVASFNTGILPDLDFANCNCPHLCDWTDLKIDTTHGKLTFDGTNVDNFYDGLTTDDTVVHVFYQSQFVYAKQRIIVHTWINLLSSFGGVFSLFLGCSFISILEIAYYLFIRLPMIYIKLRKEIYVSNYK